LLRRLCSRLAALATSERWQEYGMMAATLAVGAVFAWLALQPSEADRRREAALEARQIASGEQQAGKAFQAILQASRAKQATDAQVADRVEREVLPAWRQARARVEAARPGPLARYFAPEMPEYFKLRQEAWESLVAGVRKNDPAAWARFQKKWEAADRLAATIRERQRQGSPSRSEKARSGGPDRNSQMRPNND
jgi:hypothetical protein